MPDRRLIPLLAVCLWLAPALHADDGLERVALGRCPLESGAVIEDCVVAYRELGPPDAPLIVFPTWYTGTTEQLVQFGYIGPGMMADTERFRVIAFEALGNGVSSSPSTSEVQPGREFPDYSIRDMITAQHRVLTESLGVDHAHAVMGVSMGGMQALQWLVSHPGFMDRVVSVEGTPWPSAWDHVLWGALRQAEELYTGDEASLQRAAGLLARLDALSLWTPEHFAAMVEAEATEEFLRGFAPRPSAGQLLDRQSQTRAIVGHDIRHGLETSLADAAHARTLIVVFRQDLLVTPFPSLELAEAIGAETLVHDSACGHMGVTTECDQVGVAAVVREFLLR